MSSLLVVTASMKTAIQSLWRHEPALQNNKIPILPEPALDAATQVYVHSLSFWEQMMVRFMDKIRQPFYNDMIRLATIPNSKTAISGLFLLCFYTYDHYEDVQGEPVQSFLSRYQTKALPARKRVANADPKLTDAAQWILNQMSEDWKDYTLFCQTFGKDADARYREDHADSLMDELPKITFASLFTNRLFTAIPEQARRSKSFMMFGNAFTSETNVSMFEPDLSTSERKMASEIRSLTLETARAAVAETLQVAIMTACYRHAFFSSRIQLELFHSASMTARRQLFEWMMRIQRRTTEDAFRVDYISDYSLMSAALRSHHQKITAKIKRYSTDVSAVSIQFFDAYRQTDQVDEKDQLTLRRQLLETYQNRMKELKFTLSSSVPVVTSLRSVASASSIEKTAWGRMCYWLFTYKRAVEIDILQKTQLDLQQQIKERYLSNPRSLFTILTDEVRQFMNHLKKQTDTISSNVLEPLVLMVIHPVFTSRVMEVEASEAQTRMLLALDNDFKQLFSELGRLEDKILKAYNSGLTSPLEPDVYRNVNDWLTQMTGKCKSWESLEQTEWKSAYTNLSAEITEIKKTVPQYISSLSSAKKTKDEKSLETEMDDFWRKRMSTQDAVRDSFRVILTSMEMNDEKVWEEATQKLSDESITWLNAHVGDWSRDSSSNSAFRLKKETSLVFYQKNLFDVKSGFLGAAMEQLKQTKKNDPLSDFSRGIWTTDKLKRSIEDVEAQLEARKQLSVRMDALKEFVWSKRVMSMSIADLLSVDLTPAKLMKSMEPANRERAIQVFKVISKPTPLLLLSSAPAASMTDSKHSLPAAAASSSSSSASFASIPIDIETPTGGGTMDQNVLLDALKRICYFLCLQYQAAFDTSIPSYSFVLDFILQTTELKCQAVLFLSRFSS